MQNNLKVPSHTRTYIPSFLSYLYLLLSANQRLRLLFFFSFFYFFVSFSYSQTSMPETDSLKGNIKSVREKLVFLNDTIQNIKLFTSEGDYGHHGFFSREFTLGRFKNWWYTLPWTHYLNYYREYDDNQNITLETWFYKDDSFLREYQFQFDDKNNLIEIREYQERDTLSIVKRFAYDYDNLKTSEIWVYPDDISNYLYINYEYDENNLLIKSSRFDEEGYQTTIRYNYNHHKKKTKEILSKPRSWKPYKENSRIYSRDTTDNVYLKRTYIYDDYQNLIKVVEQNYEDNYRKSSTVFNYDSNNRIIKKMILDQNDSIRLYWTYEYVKDIDFKTKESLILPKFPDDYSVLEFVYDKNNRILKLFHEEDKKVNLVEFEYKFDKKRNWYEQLKKVNGKSLYLRKREIVYFDD